MVSIDETPQTIWIIKENARKFPSLTMLIAEVVLRRNG
jgi:hypothetical protein